MVLSFPISCLPQDIKVDVNLVSITCSVSNRDNTPVTSLGREEFTVLEDGVAQELRYFGKESDQPLTLGLLIDVSGSQAGYVRQHRKAIEQFLKTVMAPGDRAFIVTFGHNIRLVQDTTGSVDDLIAALATVDSRGRGGAGELFEPSPKRFAGTRLWDAVYQASRARMRMEKGRKALLILTDGFDEGSARSLTDAIEAAQGADTLVYSIRYVSKVFIGISLVSPVAASRLLLEHGLSRLGKETGGVEFGLKKPELATIFEEIERELRTLYILGYTPRHSATDGQFHKVEVRAKTPGIVARTRAGYYARAD